MTENRLNNTPVELILFYQMVHFKKQISREKIKVY